MKPIQITPDPWQTRMGATMLLSCGLTAFLVLLRLLLFRHFSYLFLVSNLVLAAVPYVMALVVFHAGWIKQRNILLIPALLGWLLAFPNAPYIITDLIHLHARGNAPLWYDAILLFTAAFNGLLLGLLSLDMMHQVVAAKFRPLTGWAFAAFSLLAGSFGIYLGRFERWNSWDVLTHPEPLAADILHRFIHPMQHPRTYAMTLVLFAVLGLAYLIFRMLRFRPEERVVRA
jgi:uncharacterized membrane protein